MADDAIFGPGNLRLGVPRQFNRSREAAGFAIMLLSVIFLAQFSYALMGGQISATPVLQFQLGLATFVATLALIGASVLMKRDGAWKLLGISKWLVGLGAPICGSFLAGGLIRSEWGPTSVAILTAGIMAIAVGLVLALRQDLRPNANEGAK